MQKTNFKKFNRIAVILLLLSAFVLSFTACGCQEIFSDEVLTKDEIYQNVHSDTKEKESVTRHLYEWGFPRFNTNKFGTVEELIVEEYYEALPARLTLATAVADKFLSEYYDNIDLKNSTAVTDALLKCYTESLGDPYAMYRVPVEQNNFVESITGGKKFVGIGVQIRQTDEGYPFINTVYKNSGAEAAGIHPCDIILAVDGRAVKEIGYNAASNALKGEAGTTVDVTVLRNGEMFTLTAERGDLATLSVTYTIDESTGFAYVSILNFTQKTGPEFREAIDELKKLGMRAVIFDLRSNTGGLLTAVKECVSYLVEDDIKFISYSKYNGIMSEEKTLKDSHKLDIPMVLITNEYTASAAEIFVAALRDYRDNPSLGSSISDVTILGEKTFGKGIMQSTYSLGDGTSVTFTSAYYNPPSGVNYHGTGIMPDEGFEVEWSITLTDGDRQRRAAYEVLEEYFADAAA